MAHVRLLGSHENLRVAHKPEARLFAVAHDAGVVHVVVCVLHINGSLKHVVVLICM